MITLDLTDFFTILVVAIVIMWITIWIVDNWRSLTRYWEPAEYLLINCSRCHYKFFIHPRNPQLECPACGQIIKGFSYKDKYLKVQKNRSD